MKYGDLNDFELLEAALNGDKGAWPELQRRHERPVTSQARRILFGGRCCDPHDHCHDVSQETFTHLWAYARTVLKTRKEGTEGLGGLLHTMCKHEAHLHLERACFRNVRPEPFGESEGDAGPSGQSEGDLLGLLEIAERAEIFWREARQVKVTRFLEILELRVKGLKHEEIAKQLGWKAVRVRQTFRRGLLELKRRLKDLL